VALIPLFPNPAYTEAEKESARKARATQDQRVPQAEAERKAAADAERMAKEQAEAARRLEEQAAAERAEKAQAEQKRRERAEAQRLARQAEEKERALREKAEAEAKRTKEEQERLAQEKAEAEKLAQEEKARKEREKDEAARLAEQQRLAREAAKERAARAMAEAEAKRAKKEQERLARERAQAEAGQRPREQAQAEPAARQEPAASSSGFEWRSVGVEEARGGKGRTYATLGGLAVVVGLILWIFWSRGQPSEQRADYSSLTGSSNVASSNPDSQNANAGSTTGPLVGVMGSVFTPPPNEWTGRGPIESVGLQLLLKIKQQTPLERVYGLAFSPDGQLLASAWQEVDHTANNTLAFKGNGSIRLWNVTNGELAQTLRPPGDQRPGDQYASVAFSPDGRLLAVSTFVIGPSTVQLWDVHNGTLLHTFSEKDALRRLAFSPDGHFLAAACDDGSVYVWNPETGDPIAQLKHPGIVVSVAFSPTKPDILAAGDYQQSVRVWNFRTSTRLRVLYANPPSYGEAVAFSPDGQTLATGHASGALVLWDTTTWKMRRIVRPGGDTRDGISSVAFSPDGQILASASGRQTVSFWDAVQGTPLGKFDISDGSEYNNYDGAAAVFSPRQHLLATTISGDLIQIMKVIVKRAGE
jgi:WD40 repeat protein/murein DD-endopeptidase MepM/ murein hydrolase activator NlpD